MAWFVGDPRIVVLAGALASTLLLSASGMLWLPRASWGKLGRVMRTLPRSVGLLSGVAIAVIIVLLGRALGAQGIQSVFLGATAVFLALVLGFYLPGLEARQHEARKKRLVLQTIDFAGYLLMALRGAGDTSLLSQSGDVTILSAYCDRPRKAVRDLQALIAAVVAEYKRRNRGNILADLHEAAKETGCRQLIDLTTTLYEVSKRDQSKAASALAKLRKDVMDDVVMLFQQRARRRQQAITFIAAGSLVFGLVMFILYVMTEGGLIVQTILS